MTYYERESDILYIGLKNDYVARSVEHEWGVVDFNTAGQPVGFECLDVSRWFPPDLLALIPEPKKKAADAATLPKVVGQRG
jgi:hypothetical protein